MELRPILGLLGILIATMAAGLDEQVVAAALPDVMGGFGMSHDASRWVTTVFDALQVVGMAIAPALGTALTLRRFAIGVIVAQALLALITPNMPSTGAFLFFRALQGLCAGLTIPLLLTASLKTLPPPKRLPGLAAYALTSTFSPNLAPSLAALWTDVAIHWQFAFYDIIPLDAIAALLVWFGADQDLPKYEKLKQFDPLGFALFLLSFCPLVVLLEQGDWLDWYNSAIAVTLFVMTVVFMPLFIWRQAVAPHPFFKLSLFKRNNFAYGVIGVMAYLVLAYVGNQIPLGFLEDVRGFKPLQAHYLTLEIAVAQVAFMPLALVLLNQRWADARWVSTAGWLLIVAACAAGGFAVHNWDDFQFLVPQLGLSLAGSFVVLSLLMMATNTVVTPENGAYASAMFNTARAMAGSVAIYLIDLIDRRRGTFHRDRVIDAIGNLRYKFVQAPAIPGHTPPALTPQGREVAPGSLAALNALAEREVHVLTYIDTFLIFGALGLAVIVVLWLLAERTYPPRIELAGVQGG